jgi:hypothetical protein
MAAGVALVVCLGMILGYCYVRTTDAYLFRMDGNAPSALHYLVLVFERGTTLAIPRAVITMDSVYVGSSDTSGALAISVFPGHHSFTVSASGYRGSYFDVDITDNNQGYVIYLVRTACDLS